MDIIALEGWTR